MNYKKRILELRNFMAENKIDLSIIMDSNNQYYISGFKALIYSRPIVLIIGKSLVNLIIPGLEENHAKAEAKVDNLYVYYEHPEKAKNGKTYLQYLDKIISKYSKGTRIGGEFNVMSIEMADYFKDHDFEIVDIGKKITEMRFIKDAQETDLLINAGKLVSLALAESMKNANEGISEVEFDDIGNKVIFKEATTKYPNSTLDFFGMSPSGLARVLMPHVLSSTRKFQRGDIIIHSRQIGLNGYHAECERTFFIGKPSNSKQEHAFNIIVEAQRAAIDFIRPGVMAKDVDLIARKIIQKAGYGEYAIHRTGHGIGLGVHETPYLRYDNDLILQEGMVFSIEPGIYIPDIGAFRHSDTVILTKNGSKLITDYSRELEKLIF